MRYLFYFIVAAVIVGMFGVYRFGISMRETLHRLEAQLATTSELQNRYADRVAQLQRDNVVLGGINRSQAFTIQEREVALLKEQKLAAKQSDQLRAQGASINQVQTELGGVKGQLEEFKKIGGAPLPKDFINKLLQASVRVRCVLSRSNDVEHFRAGSGSLLGRYSGAGNGIVIMTNAHVVAKNDRGEYDCEVVFGEDSYYHATVLRRVFEDIYDFALLKLGDRDTGPEIIPVSYDNLGIGFCEFADLEIGDKVTMVTFPQFQVSANAETHGAITQVIEGPIYETTAPIDQGSSGGVAILDKKRCALGMPTWKGIGSRTGLSYIQSWPMMLSFKSSQ